MPRKTALEILDAVLVERNPLDQAIESHSGFRNLDLRDRALSRNLVTTTLRRLGQIDDLINHCLERKLPRKAQAVRQLLRLGVCQLLFMDIAAHAAVDTTVKLAVKRGHGPHKALINAILRRLGREGAGLIEAQDRARVNTPGWLWESWETAYGPDVCRRIAEAHLTEPLLDITPRENPETWAEKLNGVLLSTGSIRLKASGLVTQLPGFAEGEWWVQDAAAVIPVKLMGNVTGKTVVDLCAAPGGKTAQLAAAGATVTAVDRSETRLRRLRENMSRLGLQVQTIAADAKTWRPETPADAVLLDAPCTATGTIRRHPDVAWLKRGDDPAKLAHAQDGLLNAAAEMVKPGGMLVYCSCSLQPEEGPDRIEAFLASNASFTRVPITGGEIGNLSEAISGEGDFRSLPFHIEGGMDGFYASRLRRQ